MTPPNDDPRAPDPLAQRLDRVEEAVAFSDHEQSSMRREVTELALAMDRLVRRLASLEARVSELGQPDPTDHPPTDREATTDDPRDGYSPEGSEFE